MDRVVVVELSTSRRSRERARKHVLHLFNTRAREGFDKKISRQHQATT
jgi:hypothetical protein